MVPVRLSISTIPKYCNILASRRIPSPANTVELLYCSIYCKLLTLVARVDSIVYLKLFNEKSIIVGVVTVAVSLEVIDWDGPSGAEALWYHSNWKK